VVVSVGFGVVVVVSIGVVVDESVVDGAGVVALESDDIGGDEVSVLDEFSGVLHPTATAAANKAIKRMLFMRLTFTFMNMFDADRV
jgi:hypothetical protein